MTKRLFCVQCPHCEELFLRATAGDRAHCPHCKRMIEDLSLHVVAQADDDPRLTRPVGAREVRPI